MAESEVTDQSLHPWAAYDLRGILLRRLPRHFTSLGTLAEGVLLKCAANGPHRGINIERNAPPLQIFVARKDSLRFAQLLIFTWLRRRQRGRSTMQERYEEQLQDPSL